MKAEQLWASILQEAIQGRLVPQLESEPEAESEGCYLANPPFSVPKKWKWVQLKSIFAKRPTVTPSVYGDSKVELWSIPAFDAGSPEIVEAKLIGSSKKVIVPGDVLLAKIVPHIKRAWVVSEKNEFIKLASTEWIVFHSERYFSEFLTMALTEPIFHAKLLSTISGMGSLKRANPKKLGEFYIPCPPIQEQIRIMEKLSKLKSIIDNYQFEHLKYTELGKRFPNQLKNSILQEAIQGKLVPQLENEPKVKQIGDVPEDVPFDIPEKWAWIQLGELINYGSSKQIEGSQITPSTWVLDLEDIEKNSGKLLKKKYGTKTTSNKSCFKKGDVLYGKLRPYLNKVLIADEDGCCSTEIVPISVSSAKLELDAEFLCYFLRSPYFVGYANSCAYGVKMPRLGTKDAKSAWVAIPPLKEQRRIVTHINELLSKVECLKAN